jgi:hypothetical protein
MQIPAFAEEEVRFGILEVCEEVIRMFEGFFFCNEFGYIWEVCPTIGSLTVFQIKYCRKLELYLVTSKQPFFWRRLPV